MKLILLPIFLMLFNINLQEYDYEKIDDSVIIIINDLYCKDCLESISKVQSIWKEKYKTVVIAKSKYYESSTNYSAKFFKLKINYDEIYFVKSDKKNYNKSFQIGSFNIFKTPNIIIKSNGKEKILNYDTLFKDMNPNRIKKYISNEL
jgi:hypothetical protein